MWLQREFPEEHSVAVDKTAWDWTVPWWVLHAYLEMKLRQTINCTEAYARACTARFLEVVGKRCIIELPSGARIRQTTMGLMKSGWLLTLSANSYAQLLQHELALLRIGVDDETLVWAMGDDSLAHWKVDDETLQRYVEALSTTGCIVKHAIRRREFAGFEFSQGRVIPLYAEKHKHMLAYAAEENLRQMVLSYGIMHVKAGTTWFDSLWPAVTEVVELSTLNAWADGLVKLEILDSVPACFTFEA